MNKYLSIKLTVLASFSMLMVVYLHSYNLTYVNMGFIEVKKDYTYFIEEFFSRGITKIAVPLFFIISGYLFFLNMEGTVNEFLIKFKKRFKTLVIPYLFWSAWGLLLYYILQSISQWSNFFTREHIKDYSVNELLSTLFINPIPYQLWFLRDLILIICLSPLIYFAIKQLKYLIVLVLLGTWLCGFNFIIISNESLFYFVCGAFLSLTKSKLVQVEFKIQPYIFSSLWVCLVLCKTTLTYIGYENTTLVDVITKLSIIAGIIAVWSFYDNLMEKRDLPVNELPLIFSFSFFLYVFHEPVLTIVKKASLNIIGAGEMTALLIYIIAPVITISISILVGYFLKRNMPNFYKIITGGR